MCFMLTGEFGINLRDHPLAQDIAKEAGLQEIPDVFIGGRCAHFLENCHFLTFFFDNIRKRT